MFKRIVSIVGASLLICTLSQAQILLSPPTASGAIWGYLSGGSGYSATDTTFWLWANTSTTWVTHGVVEFNLNYAGLPTALMTSNNFTAKLNNMSVVDSGIASGTMIIDLFDLDDAQEDDVITLADHGASLGTAVATSTHDFNGTAASFSDVDVTAQLRRDLFGAGTGDPTTGFILTPQPIASSDWVGFLASAPEIVITVTPDTDTGGDTDTDTDVDTDTDTDTDTDADTDADSDADDDRDDDDDSGCGCSRVGRPGLAATPLKFLISLL